MFDDLNGDGAVNMADINLYRPQVGTVLPELKPQLAAGGEGPGGVPLLTPSELAPVLTTAIDDWAAAGLPAADVTRLRGVSAQITNLPPGWLGGTAIGGNTIYVSADADGYGWSIDTAPENSGASVRSAAMSGNAADTSSTAGHEDLLTVVMHELGHTLGLEDLTGAWSSGDLMAETLATGVRRLPSALDVATVEGIDAGTFRSQEPAQVVLVDAVIGVVNADSVSPWPARVRCAGTAGQDQKLNGFVALDT